MNDFMDYQIAMTKLVGEDLTKALIEAMGHCWCLQCKEKKLAVYYRMAFMIKGLKK